jgi:hypothetical protein
MLAAHIFDLRINLTKHVVLSISGVELSLQASARPKFLQIRPGMWVGQGPCLSQ